MSTQGHEKEAVNVEGLKAALKSSGNKAIYNEAICSTAGGTAAKVTNTVPPSFSLVSGAKILVKFTYAITVANATLQVGTNAAKPIFYHGAVLAANLVKAGTLLLLAYDGTNFNIVGDINTDTTYQVMGASGASHASGLVPDTPSDAGTTKFLREDGTWQEPAGQNYSAGDGIDISNNEISADNTIARKTDLAPAKLGSGIGTCSTSSGTALEATLSDYNLVQNGIVAVTFANDVPANATLNINSKGAKPIIYKGSAITADTIKADDTALFSYDGTNYVLISSGGSGGGATQEFAVISLKTNYGNDSALTGATIVITDDNTSETILSTTWSGTDVVVSIDGDIEYTVTVENVEHYDVSNTQSYTSLAGLTRNITFTYTFVVFVDMGLPSGVKWARTNIDVTRQNGFAESEFQYGCSFFSWGNIEGHNPINDSAFGYDFSTANYNASQGANLTGNIPVTSIYDAARAICGSPWRMPTSTEFQELINNSDFVQANGTTVITGTNKLVTVNNVLGIYLKSKINGNLLFFACCGTGADTQWTNKNYGHYQSSSYSSSSSQYILRFYSSAVEPQLTIVSGLRTYGFAIRPVM